MCGIFGNVRNANFSVDLSRSALNTLIHRGPDQEGEYLNDYVYLGHRRLSILDLSNNGRQPMISEDVVITVNGEIYNYKTIKKLLESKYFFKSTSDSEIILHGYKEWGIDGLLERIDGMFAICIYDVAKREVILIRDRVGIKPVFYGKVNGNIAWASELKALQTFYNRSLQTDKTAFYDYLTYLYIPRPKTRYKDVYKLNPGHYLKINIDSGDMIERVYWELETDEIQIGEEEAAAKLKELIAESVGEQLMSDVPIGFFLSGGMDSSCVVAEAATILDHKISTFTIGFSDGKYSEIKDAVKIAELFKTNHYNKILELSEAQDLFTNMHNWFDEPYADTSALPTYLVSKYAREVAKVVLTGDGGDELFGGYNWYTRFSNYSKNDIQLPAFLKPLFSRVRRNFPIVLLGKFVIDWNIERLRG
jgi:asparagine synthase (glutamine-hydrolysing)